MMPSLFTVSFLSSYCEQNNIEPESMAQCKELFCQIITMKW
jgi:hypothetical protein